MDFSLVLQRLPHSFFSLKSGLFGLIFLSLAWTSAAEATAKNEHTVIVVKTSAHPRIDAVVKAIETSLTNTATIRLFDLQGQAAINSPVVQELTTAISGKNTILVGIGTPATALLAKLFPDLPLIYTLTRPESISELDDHDQAFPVRDKASLETQLKTLRHLVAPLNTVGILVGPEISPQLAAELKRINKTGLFDIAVAHADSEREVAAKLSELCSRVDALLFIQDPNVLNRRSLEYIVTQSLAKKKPSVVYSEYLVRAGFLTANLVTPQTIGEDTKALVERLINKQMPAPTDGQGAQLQNRIVGNLHTLEMLDLAKPVLHQVEYLAP